jgi:hypothetical protein
LASALSSSATAPLPAAWPSATEPSSPVPHAAAMQQARETQTNGNRWRLEITCIRGLLQGVNQESRLDVARTLRRCIKPTPTRREG